jgi:DNA-binding NtrC family response regulator
MKLRDRLQPILETIADADIPLADCLALIERQYVEIAIRRTNGNLSRAAILLGVHRNTLHYKYTVADLRELGSRRSVLRDNWRKRRNGGRHVCTG